jgi:hypothetical protein
LPGILLVAILSAAFLPASSAQRPPGSQDFKPPAQDLKDLEGEVVWLQGAILHGSPAPYRNPAGPLAAYEQGLLDEEGQLWTLLDTPRGRELRYNPDLRGKRIKVKGWLYPKSHIIEVQEWKSGKHKVRADEGYEAPERLPFNPLHAETIETIPPIQIETLDSSILKDDLWKMGEGYDLGIQLEGSSSPSSSLPETSQLKQMLDDLEQKAGEAMRGKMNPPAQESGTNLQSATGTSIHSPEEPRKATLPPPSQPPKESIKRPPSPPVLNEQGKPLTRPDEFDSALQKELIDQIAPQK